ncbi:bacillithiol biosynthesis cysteine-adding enzyme BshC [Flaviaesturariibacter flavus]|uniref:Putative cysteine ligase BshC n=1 Tax=Flaviaesturariibacter flavus TaxID=2502780 RepID=A0A4R1B9Z4_9BACT|nr:bacillithiol biosynthesis cysteine-adding enzyme BshC [Flaviaesturariibacter flavus]TCJ13743.1 bacillithiol biosynthesis cysteine-adding enzyme BshC [Flaviaesturariibacter flavus]
MFAAETLAYRDTHSFTRIVSDYLGNAEALRPFYSHRPDLDGIRSALEQRSGAPAYRQTLVAALRRQYEGVEAGGAVGANIGALLSSETFTVTTAHQPNLATGPLYFLYKILHAIKLADDLGKAFPGKRFVPVYYMGSEDADLEELNHFTVAGKRYTWNTGQKGAVGRMYVDKALTGLLRELEGQVGNEPHGAELLALLRSCYAEGRMIQDATFQLVHALFGRYGLVVLLADAPELKRVMIPVFSADLFGQEAGPIVAQTSAALQAHYNVQAHPREINLFYFRDDIRERIEKQGEDEYCVVNTDIRFREAELRAELDAHPERFSPNVILRGLYQETILPNVAFIGGGGELAYWLQLKDLFGHYGVPFPVLVLRNSFLVVPQKEKERADRLQLSTTDLFLPVLELMNRHLERSGQKPQLNGEVKELEQLYERLRTSAAAVDITLDKHVEALRTRSLHLLTALEQKMQRAARRKEQATQRQLEALKTQLFPKNGLQERVENFAGFYALWGDAFIDLLYRYSGGLAQQFTVIYQTHSAS